MPSVSVRKRNGKRAHVSRAAQLEAKLEDLVSLLRHQAAPAAVDKALSPGDAAGSHSMSTPALSTHSTTSPTTDDSPRLVDPVVLPPQQPDCDGKGLPVAPGTLLGCVFNPQATTTRPVPPRESPTCPTFLPEPSPVEAAESLMTFRKYMLIFLPFVHLPATMTSERLKETYPFLWYNVMTATCKNVDRRLAMGEAVKKFLGQKMLMDNEKSLDLLLGLIVILGW